MCCVLSTGHVWRATAAAQASRASAGGEAMALEWHAPRDCGSRAAVESELARLLGVRLEQLPAGTIEARGEVTRHGSSHRLRLQLTTHVGTATRQLQAASCDELVEAAAWLIALAIDPTLSARPAADSSSIASEPAGASDVAAAAGTSTALAAQPQTAAAPTAAATQPAAPTAPVQDNARRAARPASDDGTKRGARPAREPVKLGLRTGGRAGVFAGGGAGTQAALSAFLGLSAGWSYSQLRVAALLPRDISLGPSASAEQWSWALDLSQCALWGARVRAGPCAVLTGLRTSVETQGVNNQGGRERVLWATAGAGFALFWRVWRRLELSAAGHIGIPISPRPRFSVEPLGPVISAEPWTVDAQLGASFVYP